MPSDASTPGMGTHMTSIRIAIVSAIAFAAVLAGGAQVQHATVSHTTTVTAASVQAAGELCCDE
jgi:hypothetical protein